MTDQPPEATADTDTTTTTTTATDTTNATATTSTQAQESRRPPSTLLHKVNVVGEAVSLLKGTATLFQDPSGTPYVTLPLPPSTSTGKRERRTLRLSDSDVRDWLRLRMWADRALSVTSADLDAALGILAAHVKESGPTEAVYTRLAPAPAADGATGLYLDLGAGNRAVHVTADGWGVVDHPLVHFQRPAGFLPLPEPTPAGPEGLVELHRFLNVGTPADEDDPEPDDRFRLLVGWLVGCLLPDGDYPILVLNGQKGSAKTSTMRMLRALVDPHEAVENAAPESGEELLLQAAQTHVSSFDNLRSVKPSFSDALCRLATGMATGKRKLYTDDTRLITKVRRPAILNGIPDLARADDLVQRTLRVRLPAISAEQRVLRSELERAFEAARPRLLGALLDAVVVALRDRAQVNQALTRRPRLADWYVWVLAAAGSGRLGFTPHEFAETVNRNLADGQRAALEANAVTDMLLLFMEQQPRGKWDGGTLHALFDEVSEFARQHTDIRSSLSEWPHTANGFRWRLHAAEADLAAVGLTIERRHDGHRRLMTLTYTPRPPEPEVAVADAASLTHLTDPNAPPNGNVSPAEPQSMPGLTDPNAPNAPLSPFFSGTEKEEEREQRAHEGHALDALVSRADAHEIRADGVNAPPAGCVRDALRHEGCVRLCLVPGCDLPIYAELPGKGLCAEHYIETEPGYDWPWTMCTHPAAELRGDGDGWLCLDCGTDWSRREDIPPGAVVGDAPAAA